MRNKKSRLKAEERVIRKCFKILENRPAKLSGKHLDLLYKLWWITARYRDSVE
jgi:hypothetical protein